MALKQTIEVLNDMERAGVISRYAIAGAVAAIYYVEVSSTDDLDVLVSFDTKTGGGSGLILLSPIIEYLAARGYDQFRHEGIVVEGWPVQFLPVAGPLDQEALSQAVDIELLMPQDTAGIETRVMRPEHIVAKAISLQRPTDMLRISQFLDQRKVDFQQLAAVLQGHGLQARWARYCQMTGRPDPLRDMMTP